MNEDTKRLGIVAGAIVTIITVITICLTVGGIETRRMAFENGYERATLPGYDYPTWVKARD